MTQHNQQQSNPYSTGGGGSSFEARVQAAFTVLMLTGGVAPCLPHFPIKKIKLQGRYAGFNTDDFIVYVEEPNTAQEAKLLAQIKHSISITEGDQTFAEVIESAWNDFNGSDFKPNTDVIALITGPLSVTDTKNVRPILEWARHSENEEEFLSKIRTSNFSSDTKQKKLDAFVSHLKKANNGVSVSDKDLWEFLKVFNLLGYDLDTEYGGMLPLLYALIAKYSSEDSHLLWAKVIDVVQTANQNAGTITFETLHEALQLTFDRTVSSSWAADVQKLRQHGQYILEEMTDEIGGIHISKPDVTTELVEKAETSNFVFVSGGRGAGKSSAIRTFVNHLEKSTPIFCLRVEELNKPHLDHVFSSMGLKSSLGELETGYALLPKKYLVLESLEKLLELEHSVAFVDLLKFLDKTKGWTVLATGREYAYQQIVFNYLQPFGIEHTTLLVSGFSDDDIQQLGEQFDGFRGLLLNPALRELLRTPFFAKLAYQVMQTGGFFSEEDGEREFRTTVWRYVIAKEHERSQGMPEKRRRTFIALSVKRAKRMVYGVVSSQFDAEVLAKLEEDQIIRKNSLNGFVSPAHDMFEDWALEQYIEEAYQNNTEAVSAFLTSIGNQPAINRAFRLWLHQKLRYGEPVLNLIFEILTNQNIQRYWQDETITAILLGDAPDSFLQHLDNHLWINNGALLKRFCFILRISCQTPIQTGRLSTAKNPLVDSLQLQPYGKGWESLIKFLFLNKSSISSDLIPHIVEVLDEWSEVIEIDSSLPAITREVGLISLHLWENTKNDYDNNKEGKKIIQILIKTSSTIKNEFISMLEKDIFVSNDRTLRPFRADKLCELAFKVPETIYLAKHLPDILIQLAYHEWIIDESEASDMYRYGNSLDVGEFFGLRSHGYDFFPASGLKGPFRWLLLYHPRKGLDFILHLLNISATKYAYSSLDSASRQRHSSSFLGREELVIKPVEIQLKDGIVVAQYCSDRLWLGYRGHSVLPYLLQCALMALENWLVEYAEDPQLHKSLDFLFDYILRNSNSVMPTATLASVATGYPEVVNIAALPLLKVAQLYSFDLNRCLQERLNFFGAFDFDNDPFYELYVEERRTATLRTWRKESLESLIVRLQFSEWREAALNAVDVIYTAQPHTEKVRFLLHRIDSRKWQAHEDKTNNRILFSPKEMEDDLVELQSKSQSHAELLSRFSALSLWSIETFEQKPLSREYYKDWREALSEVELLLDIINDESIDSIARMYYGGIVTTGAVLIRDHLTEMSTEEQELCIGLLVQAIQSNLDTENEIAIADITNWDGAMASATVLPILFDILNDEDKLELKQLIAASLTHVNESVRHATAKGIRDYLWERDYRFAQNCIDASIEYAYIQQEYMNKRWHIPSSSVDKKEEIRKDLQLTKDNFRQRLAKDTFNSDYGQISLRTYNPWHILTPCFMIPFGSTDENHIKLVSRLLELFFDAEQHEEEWRFGNQRTFIMSHETPPKFAKYFSSYLLHLPDEVFETFVQQLQLGCEVAPSLMRTVKIHMAAEAERIQNEKRYWQLWKALSPAVQKIALETAPGEYRRTQDDKLDLIRSLLHTTTQWQQIDLERQNIRYGKDLIFEFVRNTGKNPIVFEAMSRFMYYFPDVFLERGIHILAKHQNEEGGIRLFTGINTSFCLQRAIQYYLHIQNTETLKREMYQSCLCLLNALVETASARAYYLREHLVRSRRMS